MFRVCCLTKGETKESLGKEVLYRRYLKFYLTFHILYALLTVSEIIAFYHEYWEGFYVASLLCLVVDIVLICGLLLRPEVGPHKQFIYTAFAMTILTLLVYAVGRLYAFFSPHVSGFYSGCIVVFLCFFVFTKAR